MSLLAVNDVSLAFGGVRAVDGVSFSIEAGEIFTIIGPNGAGKSTLFNLISRFYDADEGNIHFDGHDITRVASHGVARRGIARTFQNIELFDGATVLQNLLLGRHTHQRTGLLGHLFHPRNQVAEELHHRERVEEIIDFLNLQHYRDQLISNLSYGVRKVVELGRALALEPRLLLLDEPSSGLNVEETEDMSFWISDIRDLRGITVVMVEHNMALVNEVSDRVLALNYGRVLTIGSPAEVQSHPDVVRAYLGGAA